MSADNAIFYRKLDDSYFVMHGFMSDSYSDDDYQKHGEECATLQSCLECATTLAAKCTVLEYGIVDDCYKKVVK